MKRNTLSTIALAAFVLLLSGTFSAAGEYGHISQNDDGTGEGSATFVNTEVAAGEIVDLNQNDGRGPGRVRRLGQPKPKPRQDLVEVDPRFTGEICLNFPVHGRRICWNDFLDVF